MDQSIPLARSQELYQQGNQFYQIKNYQEAIKCYNISIQLDPQNYKALFSKGNILKDMKDYNEAIKCYDEALQYAPSEASIHFNKGNALQAQGKYNEAIQCYVIAIKNNPKERKFYINQGNALRALNRHQEAIQSYDKAIEINPQDPLPLSNKGNAFFTLNKIEEAVQCYDLAIQKDPNFAEAYYHKGVALKVQNKDDQVLKCFSTAIEKNPKHILSYCNRAMLYLKLQNKTQTLEDLSKAQQLAQDESNFAALNQQNIAYVNKILKEETRNLIGEIANLQEVSLDIELKMKSTLEQNQNTIDQSIQNQYQDLKLNQNASVKKGFEVLNKGSSEQEIYQLKNQIEQLKNQYLDFQSQINKKVDLGQVEVLALKVVKEIDQNENLKSYFDALYNKMHLAVQEAETICSGGKLQLNKENSYVQVLTLALTYIPFVGNLVSSGTKGALNQYKANTIKEDAAKMITSLHMNPQTREEIIKKTAEKVTLSKQNKILNAAQDQEVLKWKEKGWVTKCKDFLVKNTNQQIYETDVQILACIDALKIIYAISSGQLLKSNNVEENIIILASVPEEFTFKGEENIKAKGNTQNQDTSSKKKCCLIYSVQRVQYQNPLLNNVHLQQELSSMTKLTISKVLRYSFKLQEMGYIIQDLDLESAACLIISLN